MTAVEDLGRALSDPVRARALRLVAENEGVCVCELQDALEVAQSTLSQHLAVLRQCGAVETDRRHKWVSYRLTKQASDIVQAVFRLFPQAIDPPSRMRRDELRMRHRVMLRVNGCCCQGPGALSLKEGGASMPNCECGCCGCCGKGCGCGCCG